MESHSNTSGGASLGAIEPIPDEWACEQDRRELATAKAGIKRLYADVMGVEPNLAGEQVLLEALLGLVQQLVCERRSFYRYHHSSLDRFGVRPLLEHQRWLQGQIDALQLGREPV